MQRSKSVFLECLGFVWALPVTMLGVLAIIGAGGWRGVTRLPSPPWRACLVFELRNPWFWPMRFVGMDLGAVIIVRRINGVMGIILEHELVHKMQCWILGPIMLVAYPLASFWAWVRYNEPYRMNWFERQARKETGEES